MGLFFLQPSGWRCIRRFLAFVCSQTSEGQGGHVDVQTYMVSSLIALGIFTREAVPLRSSKL